jgi:hypothetical protein
MHHVCVYVCVCELRLHNYLPPNRVHWAWEWFLEDGKAFMEVPPHSTHWAQHGIHIPDDAKVLRCVLQCQMYSACKERMGCWKKELLTLAAFEPHRTKE